MGRVLVSLHRMACRFQGSHPLSTKSSTSESSRTRSPLCFSFSSPRGFSPAARPAVHSHRGSPRPSRHGTAAGQRPALPSAPRELGPPSAPAAALRHTPPLPLAVPSLRALASLRASTACRSEHRNSEPRMGASRRPPPATVLAATSKATREMASA
jgi:hypothetical protein